MSSILGFARVGSTGHSLQAQLDQLTAAGASTIFKEQSADPEWDKLQLSKMIATLREGDTVVVTSLDRVARNTRHLLELVETLNTAGVSLKVLDNDIDTSTPNGELLRMLLGVIADFERQTVRERQAEGIARAKREGRYKGRKPTARAKADEVLELNAKGLTRQKIADELGIGVASVYRILKLHVEPQKPLRKIVQKSVDKPKKVEPKKVEPKKVEPKKVEPKKVEPKKVERKKIRESSAEQLSFF